MAGILFVTGGDDVSRAVYRIEGRGYWSDALPLILEKHGYLSVEIKGPDTLTDPTVWERYDAVLVARLPPGTWTATLAARARVAGTPILVEGPLPPELCRALGIEASLSPEPEGSIEPTNRLYTAASDHFAIPIGEITEPGTTSIRRRSELEWTSISLVPISAQQAAAWRRRAWDVQYWKLLDGGTVLAVWRSASSTRRSWPAIVKRGSLIGCAFGLFAFLGQRHTSEPFLPREHRVPSRSIGLEALLLGLIDEMHRDAEVTRMRVLPWPEGHGWIRSVRHDVDRPISAAGARKNLAGHARARSVATWHWRAKHADSEALPLVAANPRHEIALHTDGVWAGGEQERAAIEAAIGRKVLGSSAHGGADYFRFQGAPNVLWADQQGLLYTESNTPKLNMPVHYHPHRFPVLQADGVITPLRVLCIPSHESFERSTRSGDTCIEALEAALPTWISAGGFLQVMNHPDLNTEELFRALQRMPVSGRLDWTAAEVADWWSRTHVAEELAIARLDQRRWRIRCKREASALALELREPDGSRASLRVDVGAGEEVTVAG